MAEHVIPILACRELDDVVPFYQALGFEVTYRQERPNPYLAMVRGGIDLHFGGVPDFDPEQSLGSVIIVVADTASLFDAFADGLRAAYGRLPVSGIPRITRPRRKQGTSGGFTVVDPGGNWLRIMRAAEDTIEDAPGRAGLLERVLLNAARQGDAHGDVVRAIGVIDAGLERHPDATPVERAPVLAYLAELLVRAGDQHRAREILEELNALVLTDAERELVSTDLADAGELGADLDPDH